MSLDWGYAESFPSKFILWLFGSSILSRENPNFIY